MSRIGKLPIAIPDGVQINIAGDNLVTVKGKLGELYQKVDPSITLNIEDGNLILKRPDDSKTSKANHGLYRSLVANMVQGVSEGFKVVQILVGVGYKAEAKGQQLELSLGFSHNIVVDLPNEIKLETINERGKSPTIVMTSCDKQLLGQVAAKIRSLRKPEPYKGKGVLFQGEVVRKKAGKSSADK